MGMGVVRMANMDSVLRISILLTLVLNPPLTLTLPLTTILTLTPTNNDPNPNPEFVPC